MIFIICFAALIVLVVFIIPRLIVFHPIFHIRYFVDDLSTYLANLKWHECPYGKIKIYVAHAGTAFGTGKTLSAVREIESAYKKYNGKKLWDVKNGRWAVQQIRVISNIDFKNIPFERLVSLSQFVDWTDKVQQYDFEHQCITVTYLLIDEASSQLNSRSFKSNFDAPMISRLLTARHVRANLILTSQRFGMVDKLMRDCTNLVISCQKIWRWEILRYFDAYALETAVEPNSVKPLRKTGYVIKDKFFDAYDTYAMVKALEKSCKSGDMLSEEEILNLRVGDSFIDAMDTFTKRQQRKKKRSRR